MRNASCSHRLGALVRLRAPRLGLVFFLMGCGAGTPAKPAASAEAADARLAQDEHAAPKASDTVKQGEQKLAANDAAAAKALFEQALANDPNDVRATFDLGMSLEMLGDAKGAEGVYRRAIELDAGFAEALNNLGVILRDRGDLSEAISMLKRATQAAPNMGSAQLNLALAMEDAGDLTGARDAYGRAAQLLPEDPMLHANYGLLLLKLNAKEEATKQLQQALDGAQGNRAALVAIGNGLRRAGDAQGALRAMEAAVKAGNEPATPALLSELALAQRAAGQSDVAVATLQKAIGLDEKYAVAHYLLGNMFAADKKYAEATKEYQRYLKLAPTGDQAKQAKERLDVIAKAKKK